MKPNELNPHAWRTLTELIAHGPDAEQTIALGEDGEPLNGGALNALSARWQSAFSALPQTQLALYFHDSFQFAAALLAAWRTGKTVLLPGDCLPATRARLLAQAYYLIGDWPAADDASAESGLLMTAPLALAATTQARTVSLPDAAVQVFTSGSTGEPVAIAKSLAQLEAELATLEQCFGAGLDGALVAGTVSHQHLYGLLFALLWPLCAGRVFAARRLQYAEDMVAVLRKQPAVLIGSPAHWTRLPDNLDWAAVRAQLRAAFSSGGELPLAASTQAETLHGQGIYEVYGSSETGGIAWRRCTQGEVGPWQTLPGVEVAIGDDALLAVRSAHLPDAQWFTLADRAQRQGQGFTLLGRADRIVKIEEKRISLTAIERRLLSSALLTSARALVLEDGRPQLVVVAVLSADGQTLLETAGKRALNQALTKLLADSVESCARPKRWRYIAELPVNAMGKTTQAALAGLFASTPTPEPSVQALTKNSVLEQAP